jgi:hypothetical protein
LAQARDDSVDGRRPLESSVLFVEAAGRSLRACPTADVSSIDERFTIADIALYAYTHCADQGGFNLTAYLALPEWFERVRSQPGYLPIDHVPR